MSNNEIVQKLCNLCDVLRDDGINYSDHVTELLKRLAAQRANATAPAARGRKAGRAVSKT